MGVLQERSRAGMQGLRNWRLVGTASLLIAFMTSCDGNQVTVAESDEVSPGVVGEGGFRTSTVGRTPVVKSQEAIDRENANRAALAAAHAEILGFTAEEIRNAHRGGLWAKRWPEIWGPEGFDPVQRFAPPPPFSAELEQRFRELGATDEDIQWLRQPIDERYNGFLVAAERRSEEERQR